MRRLRHMARSTRLWDDRARVSVRVSAVSIVIVAYESGEFLRRCLAAVGSGHGDVIVVDNGSSSGETRLVCSEFPTVRLIERSSNEGFGTAANVGIAASEAPWILLLNPDAWPQGDAIDRLVRFAKRRPRVGAAGPLLSGLDGRPQRSAIRPPLGPAALALWAASPRAVSGAYGLWRSATAFARRRPVRTVEFLQGAVLLLRREAFDEVRGFDESFFMYGEDADLCARLRDAQWEVVLCPDARFVHVGGGSTGRNPERMRIELLRSWLRLIAKRKGMEEAERARRWLLLALRLRALALRGTRERAAAGWLASGGVGDLLTLPR